MKDCRSRPSPARCLASAGRYFTRQYLHQPIPLPAPRAGNRARLLVNGSEALPAMLALIDGARHSIRWQVMLFHPDEIGLRLADALAGAARRGVQVQLSFGIGQSMNGSPADNVPPEAKQRDNQRMRQILGVLRGAGVEVRENAAGVGFGLGAAGSRARAIQCDIKRAVCIPANHYDHRKLLVVDGRCALVGGMNVGRHYLYSTAPDLSKTQHEEALQRRQEGLSEAWDKWLDVCVLMEGPLVEMVCAAFDWKWEVLGGASIPVGPSNGGVDPLPGSNWIEDLPGQYLEQRPGHPEISTHFFDLVQSARSELWVASPFISYTPAMEALTAAAKRGVRVLLVAPNAFQEMPLSGRIFHELVPDLLAGGVEVWFNDFRMAHTKLLVADRRHTLLGSFNLNFRSFLHDLEAALAFDDERLAESAWQHVFAPYLQISRRVETFARKPFNPVSWIIRPFT